MHQNHLSVLAAELTDPRYDGLSALQARRLFHEVPMKDVTVPVPFTHAEVMGLLSQGTIGRLVNWVHFVNFQDKISAQDRVGIADWLSLLEPAGMILPDERAAILKLIGRTTEEKQQAGSPRSAIVFAGQHPADSGKRDVEGKPIMISCPNSASIEDFDAAWRQARPGG